jgi:predicted metalloprotease
MPTDQKELLKSNPIYALKVPAKCPDQGRPSSKAAFRAQVKALMDCENAAWKKALAVTPVEFSKPKVEFYGTKTKSACGTLGSTFPAAYCSADKTMYFATAAYQQGRYYRLAVAQFVMHEYAHHVQQLADITPSSVALRESDALTSRRIELQAHCMAHYQLTHSDLGFDSLDRSDAEYQFGYTNDPKGHGSVKAERYWGRAGLNGSTIGACNTWKVKPSKVA